MIFQPTPSARRRDAGKTVAQWAAFKKANCIVTNYDQQKARGFVPEEPPPRSPELILADAAAMLTEQWEAQRKRWGWK